MKCLAIALMFISVLAAGVLLILSEHEVLGFICILAAFCGDWSFKEKNQ